jgi:outer membrane receptor protein involved in Fe transport
LPRIGGIAVPTTFVFPARTKTKSYAAFADATFYVTPQIGIIAGIRYSKDKKDDRTLRGTIAGANGIFGTNPLVINGSRNVKDEWDAWTPRFGIEFKPNPDLLFYATASRGFKSGGLNSYDLNAPFDPETIWAYEAGAKTELLDRRLRLNGSVFHYDYSDLQVSTSRRSGSIRTAPPASSMSRATACAMRPNGSSAADWITRRRSATRLPCTPRLKSATPAAPSSANSTRTSPRTDR